VEFYHDTDTDRQRYKCECGCRFDYLTGTVFDGRHQAITISIMAMYHTGLNFSNAQVARELDLNVCDVHDMRTAIRDAVCQKKPSPILKDHIEFGAVFNMDEYRIYDRVNDWGYQALRRSEWVRGWEWYASACLVTPLPLVILPRNISSSPRVCAINLSPPPPLSPRAGRLLCAGNCPVSYS
jgi:hypothetical protein